jgi:hypothetical protein
MLGSLRDPRTYTIHLCVDWSFSSLLSGGIYLEEKKREREREKKLNSFILQKLNDELLLKSKLKLVIFNSDTT